MKESDCVIPYLPFSNHLTLRGTEETHNKLAALTKDHSYTIVKFQCDESCHKCAQKDSWEKLFECKKCSHKFSRQADLKRHRAIHRDEKCFECSICNYKFIRGRYLKVHMSTHIGEKPFKCNICSRTFSRKNNLKVHTILLHSDNKLSENNVC